MSLNGFVIWGEKGQTLGWVEPFSATVRVTEGGDCLEESRLPAAPTGQLIPFITKQHQ